MTNSYFQTRTSADDLLQFTHLTITIGKGDGKDDALLLHQLEHTHHLITRKRTPQEAMAWDGHTLKTLRHQRCSLFIEAVVQVISHATDEKTIREAAHHLRQIVVLQTIDKLLNDHCRRHLSIIHIREEHLGRILTVDHKRRQHLYLFTQEQRAPVMRGADHLTIPRSILFQPQMTMGINDKGLFHHD